MITILLKDLRQNLRDGTLILFGLILPLSLAFMFTMVMGGSDDGWRARYALADLDGGPTAKGFSTQVLGPLVKAGNVELLPAASTEHATRLTEQGDVDAAFVIPEKFSSAVADGRPTTLQIIGSVDAAGPVQIARAIAEGYAAQLRSIQLAVSVAGQDRPTDRALAERAAAAPQALSMRDDAALEYGKLDSTTYFSAGMSVFFLFLVVMTSITGIFDEVRHGTMARLLAAPIPSHAILSAKLMSAVVIGLTSMAVVAVTSTLVLGARWGDILPVGLLLVATVLAATGIMALATTFARNPLQASNQQTVIATTFGLIGGAFFPVTQFGAFEVAAQITPHYWFMRGLAGLTGAGSSALLQPVSVLLGFAAICGGLALIRSRGMFQS